MVATIRSSSDKPNDLLVEAAAQPGEGNLAWLLRAAPSDGVLLVGGSSLADFRVRVAQSALRADMLPSFWSFCGVRIGPDAVVSVPLDLRPRGGTSPATDDASHIPACNAVRTCALAEFDDPDRFPNVAVIRFAERHDEVGAHIERIRTGRGIVDLGAMMLPWLGFVWGASGFPNPLVEGKGLPGAAFVETVFAMAGLELTPGLSSTSSCPEAIWQSAKWWGDFYGGLVADAAGQGPAAPIVPQGAYVVRQPAAAVVG